MRRLTCSLALALALALAATACVNGGPTDTATNPRTSETQTSPLVSGATTAAANPNNVALAFRRLTGGLTSPVSIASPDDGTGRIFIVEQRGVIRIWQKGRLRNVPYLDIQSRVNDSGNEQGMLGMAFHPDFKTNRFFFVTYTDGQGDLRLVRFRAGSTYKDNTANAGSHTIILQVEHRDYSNHNGGEILFGARYLFLSTGDGGSGGDPDGNAQDVTSLLGKILRLDVDNTCGSNRYCKPASNPFVGVPGKGEVFHYGLRNPWRVSRDRANGSLWIADVGQDSREEINRVGKRGKGINFGWDCREGRSTFQNNAYCAGQDFRDPISQYAHQTGRCAVIGGHVYRGSAEPELRGIYTFADHCSREVWGVGKVDGAWRRDRVGTAPGMITSFGERGHDGELFAVTREGNLYRVRARSV